MRYICVIAALFLVGCQNVRHHVHELPLYQAVVPTLAPKADREPPIVVHADQWTPADGPQLYPFALIKLAGNDEASVARRMEREGHRVGAEVVIASDAGQQYTGSVGTYWGFGVSSSAPTFVKQFIGVCYRVAESRCGIAYDDTGMVTGLGAGAREAGLLEGDRIVTLNGLAVQIGEHWYRSPHFRLLHDLEPGSEIEAVWIRPGAGRMSGTFLTLPNEGDLSAIPAWEELGRERLEAEENEKYTD